MLKRIARIGKKMLLSPYTFLKTTKAPTWLLEGKEKHSGNDFSILFAGSSENKNYITSLCFSDTVSESYLGAIRLWDIGNSRKFQMPECNLIITQAPKYCWWLMRSKPQFMIPDWLYCEIDLSEPIESLIKKSSSMKRNMQRIRQHEYIVEVTGGLEKYEMYYNTMYSKYVLKKYSGQILPSSYSSPNEDTIDNFRLILIKKERKYLGGLSINFPKDGNVPIFYDVGVTDGNHEYVKQGVIHAAYYYSLMYLREQGYKRVSTGLNKAFIDDGVFKYKRGWNCEIMRTGKSKLFYCISIQSYDTAIESFLVNNPFIYMGNDTLKAAIFLKNGYIINDETIDREIKKKYRINGISEIDLFTVNSADKTIITPCRTVTLA